MRTVPDIISTYFASCNDNTLLCRLVHRVMRVYDADYSADVINNILQNLGYSIDVIVGLDAQDSIGLAQEDTKDTVHNTTDTIGLAREDTVRGTIKEDTVELVLCSLRKREQAGDQKSQAWLLRRHDYITASVSAACCGLMGAAARRIQLLEKATWGAYRPFVGGYYTDKGNLFEPVTNSIYCKRNGTRIHAFGLIEYPDQEQYKIAASTDGVTDSLYNIEIKTLPSRKLDGKIKKAYYHQMQHQMVCLGLQRTHFLEAKYTEYTMPQQGTAECGYIIEYWDGTDLCYLYDTEWAGTKWADMAGCTYIRTIYWTLDAYMCQEVQLDPTWIQNMGPLFVEFYKEVVYLRENPEILQQLIMETSGTPSVDTLLL